MFRQLIGGEAGSPDSYSVPFPGGEVSLSKPKQLFVLSPSRIAVPPITHMGLTTSISSKIPLIAPAPATLPVPTFTRAYIATFVNSQGLIEVAPPNTPRFDHGSVTLAPKGLLLEEPRTNLFNNSNLWVCFTLRITVTMTSDFSIFASGQVAKITGTGAGSPVITRVFTLRSGARTLSCLVSRDTNNFVQFHGASDSQFMVNYAISTGTIGTIGSSVSSASIQP